MSTIKSPMHAIAAYRNAHAAHDRAWDAVAAVGGPTHERRRAAAKAYREAAEAAGLPCGSGLHGATEDAIIAAFMAAIAAAHR